MTVILNELPSFYAHFPTDNNYKYHHFFINKIDLYKVFIENILPCIDSQQRCTDWKFEVINHNNSIDFSKLEEAIACLIAFLERACSEMKVDKAAVRTNLADLQRTNCLWSQRGVQAILKSRSLVLPKRRQQDVQ